MKWIRQNLEMLSAVFVMAIVLLWLSGLFYSEELKQLKKGINLEMQQICETLESTIENESNLLEVTAQSIDAKMLKPENRIQLKAKIHFDLNRKSYNYGIFIKPDTVINGIDAVNPTVLSREGKKLYGDSIYWSKPYINYQQEVLSFPIYRNFEADRVGVSGFVYTAVDASGLLRAAKEINVSHKGLAFLISDDKEVIQLLEPSADREALIKSALDDKLESILSDSYQEKTGMGIITSRLIGNSRWHLVTLQMPDRGLKLKIMAFLFTLLPMGMAGLAYVKSRKGMMAIASENDGLRGQLTKCQDQKVVDLLEWLTFESYLVEKIRLNPNPKSELMSNFKTSEIVNALMSKHQVLTISLVDYVKWQTEFLVKAESTLVLELGAGSDRVQVKNQLISEMMVLFDVLSEDVMVKRVEIQGDQMNQMIIVTLFGESLPNMAQLGVLLQTRTQSILNPSYQRTCIGNRIVYKWENFSSVIERTVSIEPEVVKLPQRVALYVPDNEGHAIVKFYLDYLSTSYYEATDFSGLQGAEIILAGKKAMQQLIEAKNLGLPIEACLILLKDEAEQGDFVEPESDLMITRPYSLEKLQQVLLTAQRKRLKG